MMKFITPILLLAAAASASSVAAQENLPPVEASEGEPASEFRTFDPTQEEWENFRSAGDIPHEGGEAVYNAVCAGCHMPDGEGAVGAGAYPALADNELLAAPSYPITLVLYGQGAMPPFGGLLDDRQIADVVNYVRSHFGNDFVAGEFGEVTVEDVAETRE
jgi:mono/diheme cytochrome c family protein